MCHCVHSMISYPMSATFAYRVPTHHFKAANVLSLHSLFIIFLSTFWLFNHGSMQQSGFARLSWWVLLKLVSIVYQKCWHFYFRKIQKYRHALCLNQCKCQLLCAMTRRVWPQEASFSDISRLNVLLTGGIITIDIIEVDLTLFSHFPSAVSIKLKFKIPFTNKGAYKWLIVKKDDPQGGHPKTKPDKNVFVLLTRTGWVTCTLCFLYIDINHHASIIQKSSRKIQWENQTNINWNDMEWIRNFRTK